MRVEKLRSSAYNAPDALNYDWTICRPQRELVRVYQRPPSQQQHAFLSQLTTHAGAIPLTTQYGVHVSVVILFVQLTLLNVVCSAPQSPMRLMHANFAV